MISIVDTDLSPVAATARSLADGYRAWFGQADSLLTYRQSEVPCMIRLTPEVALVGVVDALGVDPDGHPFFREDKSASPRSAKTWKRHWVMSPQSLTYALITGIKLALVRRAFKTIPPTFDHEWFSFTERELRWWRTEVLDIAAEIQAYRDCGGLDHWPLNIEHGCFAFGENYPCPFYGEGCSKQDFTTTPKLMTPTAWHFEMGAQAARDIPVVIDATRIKAWMRCREYYRRTYESGSVVGPPSDDLLIGKLFHSIIGAYTTSLIPKGDQNGRTSSHQG